MTFIFFGYDKTQAKRGKWRVPELVLHALSLVGGFVGAGLGMVVFRHKIRKPIFWIVVAVSAALWLFVYMRFVA
ncbi:MAG: DUF1294 domain-containing protein [Caldilineaceae bacterium]|nr:DUF1294 domain-containing protein [Caldilineaceae bacterium]